MTASPFQYYTQSPIIASLRRKGMNLPLVTKQILSNLKNLFMIVKTNIIRSRHLFLSIEPFSILKSDSRPPKNFVLFASMIAF